MAKQENNQDTASRVSVIETVQKPINFFALVVLVVEVILGITANFSQGTDRTYLIIGMLVLIFTLVLIVAGFAFFRPEALSGKRPTKTQKEKDMQQYNAPLKEELPEDLRRKLKLFPAYEMLLIPGYDLSLISDILENCERFERWGTIDLEAISRARNITSSTIKLIIDSMIARGYLQEKGKGYSLTDRGRELLDSIRTHLRII